eukprot:TRINITY_DN14288_c0_g1_i1.p2 TRINITY_DN14288_c0_g1~~TRINITY_DN14288_c0_g1_i1.p2  ORF type:complete len:148 (+),score=6.95 TRINITY_DN14288_c0_g1_i1:82-525(+)
MPDKSRQRKVGTATLRDGSRIPIIRKKITHVKRHHSERFKRVKEAWRKPRGIDNRTRRRFKGTRAMPKIGFGTDRRTRNRLQTNGLYKFTIKNEKELEALLMHNDQYCAEIAACVGQKMRIVLIERARQLGVRVVNAKGRLRSVEAE